MSLEVHWGSLELPGRPRGALGGIKGALGGHCCCHQRLRHVHLRKLHMFGYSPGASGAMVRGGVLRVGGVISRGIPYIIIGEVISISIYINIYI